MSAATVSVETGTFILGGTPSLPTIVGKERAILPCGCTVYVGLRCDTRPPEAVTLSDPCGVDHLRLMERFGFALTDSLVNPSTRPLIDVVAELLEEVVDV